MSDSGHELRENNEKIVKLMALLKKQRDEINYLIEKQEVEKSRIQNDIEKLTFKLTLLTKSLGQRIQARRNYDKTIHEIEENYTTLVVESGKLLFSINKEVEELEQIMDKKIGTPSTPTDKQPPSTQDSKPSPVSAGQARRPSIQSDRSTASQRSQKDRASAQAERPSQVQTERTSAQMEKNPRSGSQVQTERTSAQTERNSRSGSKVLEKSEKSPILISKVERPSILMDKSLQDERPSIQTQRSERPSVQILEKKDRPSILLTLKQQQALSLFETTEDSEDEPPFKDMEEGTKFSISKSTEGDRRSSTGSKSRSADDDDDRRSVRSADEDKNRSFDEYNKRIGSSDKKTARISEKEATTKRPTETSEGFPFAEDDEEESNDDLVKPEQKKTADAIAEAVEEDEDEAKAEATQELKVKTESSRSLRQDCGRKNCSNKSLQSSGTECSKRQCCQKSADKDGNKKHCHKDKISEERIEVVEKRVNKHSNHSKSGDQAHWKSISDTEQKETYFEEKTPHEYKKELSKETRIKRVKSSSGVSESDEPNPFDDGMPGGKNRPERPSKSSSVVADFQSVKEDSKHDEEVQSFRDAYGRQHSQQSPAHNIRKNDTK